MITGPRPTYTRRQVEVLLDVTERTLIRWAKKGKPPRPYHDPNDPLQRVLYDREEVDKLAKQRRRRKSGAHRIGLESREVTVDLAAFEPAVPGTVAAVIVKLLRNGLPVDEICERTGAALEHVVRIERLRRQFEAERMAPPARDSQTRIVVDDDDPVAAAWARQVDEQPTGNVRSPPRASEALAVDDETTADEGPSSRRRA